MLLGCTPMKLVRVQPKFVNIVTVGTKTSVATTETVRAKELKQS